MIIALHVLFDLLLLISLISCCIRNKKDFDQESDYDVEDYNDSEPISGTEGVHYDDDGKKGIDLGKDDDEKPMTGRNDT